MRLVSLASLLGLAVVLSACGSSSGTSRAGGWSSPPPGARSADGRSSSRPATRRSPRVPTRPVVLRPAELEATAAVPTASGLVIPVVGVLPGDLKDSFTAARSGGRTHKSIDIAAPRGTPLVAVEDGYIRRKHWNALGGKTLYLTSSDDGTDYYYAHLDTYADGIEIGTRVRQGDVLGTVGSTGNARGPHLHFQVLDRSGRGRGTPINPYDLLSVPAIAER